MRISILTVLLLTGCSLLNPAPVKEVVISDQTVKVEVASTPEELQRGLAGRTSLAQDEGMLFIFPSKEYYTFWMKDMLIPLDIIWLEDNTVVDLSEDVKPPKKGDTYLPRYVSDKQVNYVLEVPAGFVAKHGVKVGDTVEYR